MPANRSHSAPSAIRFEALNVAICSTFINPE
jgi:hypothetical protein